MDLLLSVASEIEIAIKNRLGKLAVTSVELAVICSNALVISYPIRRHHADRLFDLPLHHKDPFDRLIISAALSEIFRSSPATSSFANTRDCGSSGIKRSLHLIWCCS